MHNTFHWIIFLSIRYDQKSHKSQPLKMCLIPNVAAINKFMSNGLQNVCFISIDIFDEKKYLKMVLSQNKRSVVS